VSETPLCKYYPTTTFESPIRTIGERYREQRPNNFPGPGGYNPTPIIPKIPAYSLTGPKYRDDWLIDVKDTPSPDSYGPKAGIRDLPGWSIGTKSRAGTLARPRKPFFALGEFLVRLPDDVSVAEARRFADAHPDLKEVVGFVVAMVHQKRPSDPIDFLRKFFEERKAERRPKRNDDDELSRLIVHFGALRNL
jgi:hypothetical protein